MHLVKHLSCLALVIAGTTTGAAVVALPAAAQTAVRCDFQTNIPQKCWQDFRDAAGDVFSSDQGDVWERVKTVGESLNSCMQCASDAFQDGLDQF